MDYNFGKLKNKTKPQKNIIYFRKSKDEMSINLTNKCPNSCCFCIRDRDLGWGVSNLYLNKDPSLNEIKKAIEKTLKDNPKIKMKKIKVCGYGEPILRINIIPKLVKFLKEKYPKATIQLTTTGWPLYHIKRGEEHFKESVKLGLDQIYLGLNALNERSYKKYVRPSINSKEAFRQTLKFITLSKKLKLKVTLSFIDFGEKNRKEIKRFSDKFKCEYNIRKLEK